MVFVSYMVLKSYSASYAKQECFSFLIRCAHPNISINIWSLMFITILCNAQFCTRKKYYG